MVQNRNICATHVKVHTPIHKEKSKKRWLKIRFAAYVLHAVSTCCICAAQPDPDLCDTGATHTRTGATPWAQSYAEAPADARRYMYSTWQVQGPARLATSGAFFVNLRVSLIRDHCFRSGVAHTETTRGHFTVQHVYFHLVSHKTYNSIVHVRC